MSDDTTDQAALVADLETTREEYEAVFDAVSEALFLLNVDEDGTIRFQRFNEREAEFTGRSTEDVRGKTPVEVFGEDLGRELRANYRECLEREQPVTYEEKLHTGEEETVWRTTLTPVVEDGRVQRIVGSAREVTELRESERELEQRLSLLENTSDVITVLDEDGVVQYQNHRREHLPGPDGLALTGSAVMEHIHPDDRDTATETFRSVLEAPGAAASNELRVEQANGEYGWYEQRVVNRTDDPAVEGVLVSSRDISGRKRRERALERLHESTRDLMTASTVEEVATVGSETATQVLDQSINGVHLHDDEKSALVPVAWADDSEAVLDGPPPALPVADSLAGRVYRTGETGSYANLAERDDRFAVDTPFRSELILPLGDHGVFIFSSTTTDRFEQIDRTLARVLTANVETALDRVEQRQQLERRNERLDEFASVLSHDLRNPLNVAEGRLEMVRRRHDSDHLDAISRAHARIQTLTDDLLTLAREGEEVGAVEPVELAAFTERCWRNVETEQATVVCDVDRTVRADRSRFQQLLENLFRNAVGHGRPDATVTVGPLDGGFFVEDDGPGIPPEHRDDVFDVGYSTSDEGTGFGLSIVRRIAAAHDWEVAVTGGTDGGARFEITDVSFVDDAGEQRAA
jgi:PAS domain S-box-containing protein